MGACPLISARCKAPVSPRGVIGRRKELEAASIIADYVALLGTKKLSLAVKALGSVKLTSDNRHPAEIHAGRFATRSNHHALPDGLAHPCMCSIECAPNKLNLQKHDLSTLNPQLANKEN
jgi:hypothetical protein